VVVITKAQAFHQHIVISINTTKQLLLKSPSTHKREIEREDKKGKRVVVSSQGDILNLN